MCGKIASTVRCGRGRSNPVLYPTHEKVGARPQTITDFRKDNVDCIKPIFKEFVYLCRSLDLYGAQLLAIDGSKFKAVNSKSNNFSEKTVTLRLKRTEEKIAEYLRLMDENDKADSRKDESIKVDGLKERISKLEEKKQQYEQVQNQMKQTAKKRSERAFSLWTDRFKHALKHRDSVLQLSKIPEEALDIWYDKLNEPYLTYFSFNSIKDLFVTFERVGNSRERAIKTLKEMVPIVESPDYQKFMPISMEFWRIQ